MKTLYTIGHSTHSEEEFLHLIKHHAITHVVDVRTVPKSRKFPWFNKELLEAELRQYEIDYLHMPGLGGFRKPQNNSINMYWQNSGFRGFADYMQTKEFEENIRKLNSLLKADRLVAVMCAEALPWRCHRFLISDAEVVRHINVIHILSMNKTQEHRLNPYAQLHKDGSGLYYPDLLSQ